MIHSSSSYNYEALKSHSKYQVHYDVPPLFHQYNILQYIPIL